MRYRDAEPSGSRPDCEVPEVATRPEAPKLAQAGTGAPAEHRGRPRMARRGLALIVVIGILGVLAALAVAFVAMAQLERRASEQRVNGARAYLLARSGIEDALARLGLGQDAAYGGEDWDDSGTLNGLEGANEVYRRGTLDRDGCPARHAMRPSFFAADSFRQPLLVKVDGRDRGYSGALSGDYASRGNTYTLKADSAEGRGFYINGGDPSVCSDPTAVSDYNTNLRRMLGILAEAIDRDAWGDEALVPDDGKPVDEADGWALIDNRPSTGWRDWDQVRTLALAGSRAKLDALKAYLTLHAWADRKVIAPHAAPAILDPNGQWLNPATGSYESGKAYHSWGEAKLDPARGEAKQGLRAPGFERIPVKDGRIVGRAPVDLSWARGNRAALVALLGGLKGLYLDETYATAIHAGDLIGLLKAAEVTLSWDPTDICHKVADLILASPGGIDTWQAWQEFCDALPDAVVMSASDHAAFLAASAASANPTNDPTLSFFESNVLMMAGLPPSALSLWLKGQAIRDILKANFNPNSGLNKFNPNLSMWKLVDKGDLLVYSTEFSLLPVSYGHQEVASAGRIVDPQGRLLASRVLKALLAGSPPIRLTTQKEYVAENLGALAIAGDESGYRLPGQAGPFITASRGNAGTWGHALPGLGGQGASLQTYPEPVVDDGAWPSVHLSVAPADYDGSIQLATLETARDSSGFYGATGTTDPGTPYRRMMMLARYTGNFDLDQSAADPDGTGPRIAPFHVTPRQNHPDFHQVTSNCDLTGEPGKQVDSGPPKLEELRYSLLRGGDSIAEAGDFKLNTLYPDGCYAERDRVPEYLDKGHADGCHGVMSFWIKANHLPPLVSVSTHGRGHPVLKWTNFMDAAPSASSPSQFLYWGDCVHAASVMVSSPPLVCQFEIGHSKDDASQEHRFGVGRYLIPRRWELLTLRWDFRAPLLANDAMGMLLNAGREGRTPSERGTQDTYVNSAATNAPTMASDITADDLSVWDGTQWTRGPHRLPLGGRGHPEWELMGMDYFGSASDATFDEFALYDFGGAGAGGAPPASSATQASPEVLASNRHPEGRYYKGSAYAGLHVSVGENNRAGEWFSAPISLGPVRLRGLAWTQIVPPELRFLPLAGTPVTGDLPPDGAVSFELVNADGTEYLLPDRPGLLSALDGLLGTDPQRLTDPAFTPVNRIVSAPFRLHAVFQPNLAEPENTPILDPLTLDDVTVTYEPLNGPRVLAWGPGDDDA